MVGRTLTGRGPGRTCRLGTNESIPWSALMQWFFRASSAYGERAFPYRPLSRRGKSIGNGRIRTVSPVVGNKELKGFNDGSDRRPFLKLGSHPRTIDGVDGVSFVVWTPFARSVHLTGDFNSWNPVSLPMRALGSSGCRELFVPHARVGQKYKYRVLGAGRRSEEKAIRLLSSASLLRNASIVHPWGKGWGQLLFPLHRGNPRESPLSIYEMHLGS